uniref:Uncharacterized protein n=1 Tax=Meloidogyne incognita TaxID=6306 RepID=A0A914KQA7_MELIC
MILDDMTYDPHPPPMPHPLPSRTPVGTNLHGDPANNNRAANNNSNGRHNNNNNNHRQMLANLRHTHATQFRHLFALFARDRIRRHHEAIAHHRAAGRNLRIINNGNDSDSDNNDNDENDEPQIELRGIERQERFYSGPDDEAFVRNFVFESEDEVNNYDHEHEDEGEEEEEEDEEEENVENDDDSIENYENVIRTDNEEENNETVNSNDADSWSDKNNVGSLSSFSDKNDDSYKTARMTTPKKKAKTTSKTCKNTLTRLGLELSSDEEEEEKGDEEEEEEEKEKEEDGEEEEEEKEKEEDGEEEEEEKEKEEDGEEVDGDNSNESFETAKDIIMVNDENFEAFERYASKMCKNSDDKEEEDKIEEEGRDDDDEMKNDEEKLKEEEKLNDSMNSSPLKNGNCNNKRLRTCTSNSMEMPQSSKIKRRLSYIQQQQEGEDVGPSTSFSSISGLNNDNTNSQQQQSQILSDARLTGEFLQEDAVLFKSRKEEEKKVAEDKEVAEAKFNETKVKERTEQLADFHAKFIELIQSLPLNIQMRKFLVYENA